MYVHFNCIDFGAVPTMNERPPGNSHDVVVLVTTEANNLDGLGALHALSLKTFAVPRKEQQCCRGVTGVSNAVELQPSILRHSE